jgi:glutamine synthetase
MDWARDNGASVYSHWFQPLGSGGVRHGLAGGLQVSMINFGKDGAPFWEFSGKELLQGETDGSSYVNGGLRATHTAGGYLTIDASSPVFLRGDTIFIPSCFTSFNGDALDEKTPLLRAENALSREGVRLMKLLGFETDSLRQNIGLEQEIFLIPRDKFLSRPDLKLTGRTVMGKDAPRGQEMCDHYMAPLSHANPALEAMKEMQDAAFKLGIPLRTRHREVAPNQFEFAPMFGAVQTQVDQNLVLMQVLNEVAAKHGLACLMEEKPFEGVNGSGKHNNWSIGTADGINLLNVGQIEKASGSSEVFPVVMAAIIKAIDEHGDLMRMAIASPGNDFRLGACEAPPAIMSTYLGESMTNYLQNYIESGESKYSSSSVQRELGPEGMAPVTIPAEDRNRTSPFPYGGHRFEFRAVGSSQNVSMVNTVLGSIVAKSFKDFADKIEGGADPKSVAQSALKAHFKCVFNGNGYSVDNQDILTKKGLWRIDSGVDAMGRLGHKKNLSLFQDLKVLKQTESLARETAMYQHYTGLVEVEAKCMVDMLNQHVIPAMKTADCGPSLDDLRGSVSVLQNSLASIHAAAEDKDKANLSRELRLKTMVDVRSLCDQAEAVCPAHLWTLPTYTDLLFLESSF